MVYIPRVKEIASITIGQTPTVTTELDHLYRTDSFVRFFIPLGYGMSQLNWKLAKIRVTGANTFTINIDTTGFDPFVLNDLDQKPQVIPAGEIPIGVIQGSKWIKPFI